MVGRLRMAAAKVPEWAWSALMLAFIWVAWEVAGDGFQLLDLEKLVVTMIFMAVLLWVAQRLAPVGTRVARWGRTRLRRTWRR